LLTTQPEAETLIAEWQEEARRKGVSLWDWLTACVEQAQRISTFYFWRSEGFHARGAGVLANARIRSWSQLEALDTKELTGRIDLGKAGVREIEERLAKRREKAAGG